MFVAGFLAGLPFGALIGLIALFVLYELRARRAVASRAKDARDEQDRELARWARRGGKIIALPVARARGPWGGAA